MNWLNKVIRSGEKIKTAIKERISKRDIENSDWYSCCVGPALKSELERNLFVCPTCQKSHRISPKQRFKMLFGDNYETIKTPVPKDDILGYTRIR